MYLTKEYTEYSLPLSRLAYLCRKYLINRNKIFTPNKNKITPSMFPNVIEKSLKAIIVLLKFIIDLISAS